MMLAPHIFMDDDATTTTSTTLTHIDDFDPGSEGEDLTRATSTTSTQGSNNSGTRILNRWTQDEDDLLQTLVSRRIPLKWWLGKYRQQPRKDFGREETHHKTIPMMLLHMRWGIMVVYPEVVGQDEETGYKGGRCSGGGCFFPPRTT